jgi:hypothetical protein
MKSKTWLQALVQAYFIRSEDSYTSEELVEAAKDLRKIADRFDQVVAERKSGS